MPWLIKLKVQLKNHIMNPELESLIIDTLKNVYDPEIPVNIYDLGLIYQVEADENGKINITMTLTAPNCPMVDDLLQEIHDKVKAMEKVSDLNINVVFDPPWERSMMSEEAMLTLGLL